MDMLTEHLHTELPKGPIIPHVQPVAALADLDPMLDDTAVRQALANAEANNQDPMSVTMADLALVETKDPAKDPGNPAIPSQPTKSDIPEKFLKPDGEVDVEKLSASTRQLDEAIEKKQQKLQEVTRSVDDLFNHYKESERKFKDLQNPDRLAMQLNPPVVPIAPPVQNQSPQQMTDQQLRELIAQDMQRDPVGTTTQLIDLIVSRKMQPFEERDNDVRIRNNIEQLAQRDPRVLQYYSTITAKLDSDPELRRLRNPYKAAWLEVKEELRLGEPHWAPALPSKTPSPVLPGGTPPSTPSSSVASQQNILANLDRIDLRDKRQEAIADEAIRAFLTRGR